MNFLKFVLLNFSLKTKISGKSNYDVLKSLKIRAIATKITNKKVAPKTPNDARTYERIFVHYGSYVL